MSRKITLLDLGGVVFNATGDSNEKINWNVITELNHKYGHRLNVGEDLFPSFLKEYNRKTYQNLSGTEFLNAVFDTLNFNSELVEMVGREREIIIVSDNYRENISYISNRYKFASWATEQIYSFDYQMEKVNPLFFKKLLNELKDYELDQMIYIDDSPKKIASAKNHGINGILFEGNEGLKNALEQLGII